MIRSERWQTSDIQLGERNANEEKDEKRGRNQT